MKNLVDVYVKTADKWELLYKNVPENIALQFWRVGFRMGENKISYKTRTKSDEELFKRQLEKLHQG